jgi:glycosyltransferase involved in cell wall biosynthesis
MAVRVSVVVRCLNEEAHIGRLLAGIEQQRDVDADVVVVDSGSTDSTLQIARRFPVRVVHIEPSDFSFGRSLNLGLAHAKAPVVVAASAHVYPLRSDWLALLAQPFEDHRVALSYGRQVGDATSAFSERVLLERWYPMHSEPSQPHPFCNNANAAVRRSVWERLRFDEDLTGLEDLDWAKRAMDLGHRVSYVADAPVAHVHRQSWTQVMDRYRREAIAHRRIYSEQRMSRLEALWLGAANVLGDVLVATRQRTLAGNLHGIVAFRTAQFLGTYRGFACEGAVPAELKRRFYYPPAIRSGLGPSSPRPGDGPVIPYADIGLVRANGQVRS